MSSWQRGEIKTKHQDPKTKEAPNPKIQCGASEGEAIGKRVRLHLLCMEAKMRTSSVPSR